MKVNYKIQRLIVEGATQAESQRIAEALRSQLSELSAAGLSPHPVSIAKLDGGTMPRATGARQIGRHIAGQIVSGIRGGRRA